MSELIYTPLNVRITFPKDLNLEQCKELINLDSKGLFALMDEYTSSIAELKITAFKAGFEWISENGYYVFTMDSKRLVKVNWNSKWIQINPAAKDMEKNIKKAIVALISPITEDIAIFVGKGIIQKHEVTESLLLLPF